MENAADALKIAFGIIMFVAALSLSMSTFSNATEAVSKIISYRDRTQEYISVTKANSDTRTVGVEAIVPTLYKAYKENFRVEFRDENDEPIYLYYRYDTSGRETKVYYVDLEEEQFQSNTTEANEHLKLLLQGTTQFNTKYKNSVYNKQEMKNINGKTSLYAFLKDNKFEEKLGEYYQEDKEEIDKGNSVSTDTPEINKTKKRVITYKLID